MGDVHLKRTVRLIFRGPTGDEGSDGQRGPVGRRRRAKFEPPPPLHVARSFGESVRIEECLQTMYE
jgi:hypothetical protein